MSSHRFLFYAQDHEIGDRTVELTGDEHRHLSRVLRIARGEVVFVTNGRGLRSACRVERCSADRTALRVERADTEPSPRDVVLALALLKKEKFAQALEQCVELGVTRFVPFVAKRSHVARYAPATIERLARVAVAAMKQSFRAWLPAVEAPMGFAAMASMCRERGRVVVGDPDGLPLARGGSEPVTVVVGPEGGLAASEVEALRASGAVFASVSRNRLRAETAAAALVAALLLPD